MCEREYKVIEVRWRINYAELADAIAAGLDPGMLVNDTVEQLASDAKENITTLLAHAKQLANAIDNRPNDAGEPT